MKPSYYKIQQLLHKLHRRVGLFIAIILLPVAITGVLLNHTDFFSLSSIKINHPTLMDWYGVEPDIQITKFATTQDDIILVDNTIFIADRATEIQLNTIKGAVFTGEFYALLGHDKMLLITTDGEEIETITPAFGLPEHGQRIAAAPNGVTLKTADGQYSSLDGLLTWQQSQLTPQWSGATPLTTAQQAHLKSQYSGNGLSLERILLDMHSGRIFGNIGVFLTDIAAFGIIFLVFTGVWMWLKRRFRT